MKYLSRRAGILAATLLLLTTLLVAPASAGHVVCGQVLTQSTVLDSDVGPCPEDGLVIGADGITLDLNGHRVFGLPTPEDVPSLSQGVGIRLQDRTSVQVKNGTVTDFSAGVAILGGSGNKVSGITARDNIGSLAAGFGDGIAIDSSDDNLIVGNRAIKNGPFDGIGVFGSSSGNTLNQNVVTDNNFARSATTNDNDGIRLEPGTSNNTVVNNEVKRNGLDGIAVFASSTDNTIGNNVVEDNGFHDKTHRKGDGIRVFLTGNNNLVEDNRVFGNAANGIRVDSQLNEILNNKTGGNSVAPGDDPAFDLHDSNRNCDQNVWSGNTFDTAFPECTKN